jgi:hypothetical protein
MFPTCCGEVIKNTAAGKDFYVCRECKQEVPEHAPGAIATRMLAPGPYETHAWDMSRDECVRCLMKGVDFTWAMNQGMPHLAKCLTVVGGAAIVIPAGVELKVEHVPTDIKPLQKEVDHVLDAIRYVSRFPLTGDDPEYALADSIAHSYNPMNDYGKEEL